MCMYMYLGYIEKYTITVGLVVSSYNNDQGLTYV